MFWEEVEQALALTDARLALHTLDRQVIISLAPHLLGAAAWNVLRSHPFERWVEFRDKVERRFGLEAATRVHDFWQLKMSVGEDWSAFVRRVEDQRGYLG